MWLDRFFDGLCARKYNDKYDTALEYLEKSIYTKSYDLLVICKNGLKYDVVYTDINKKCNECMAKYTSDTVESLHLFLEKVIIIIWEKLILT